MLPEQLTADSFRSYPPEARALAVAYVALLQQLPLTFLPLLLRELISYDWKFPAERSELDRQFRYLSRQSDGGRAQMLKPFSDLKLSPELAAVDWVDVPAGFSERLSAYLWSSHQIDAFRKASVDYVHAFNAAEPTPSSPLPSLAIVVAGKDASVDRPLFRKLRSLGVHYTAIDPQPVAELVNLVAARAVANPKPFAHWYIDGAAALSAPADVTCVSYSALQPVREALLAKMSKVMAPGGGGPEVLQSELQRLTPSDIGFAGAANPVLSRFQLSLLTEGSGTQIFSTAFVQWASREALRRAQPSTLLARFTPRRRDAAIRGQSDAAPESLDPDESLVDAEMGAYYTWINQQRLPDANQSRFVVWYEAHNEAVAIAPGLRAGTQATQPVRIVDLVQSLS